MSLRTFCTSISCSLGISGYSSSFATKDPLPTTKTISQSKPRELVFRTVRSIVIYICKAKSTSDLTTRPRPLRIF
jgi:hypothetical protein